MDDRAKVKAKYAKKAFIYQGPKAPMAKASMAKAKASRHCGAWQWVAGATGI